FIAISRYVKNHTEKYLNFQNKPVVIINHSVNIPPQELEIPTTTQMILFAGTVCEKKGIRQLIEAFHIVKLKYPEKMLHVYGRDWFYPDGTSYIKRLRDNYGENYFKNVIFHGSISREELIKKYSEAIFCVFPSHMETQGLVCLEAMALK